MVDYELIFESQDSKYCTMEGKFYCVKMTKPSVNEISFEELLVDYMSIGNNVLKKFLMIYIRLCIKTIGIDFESVHNKKDLDAIIEIYFKEGLELIPES